MPASRCKIPLQGARALLGMAMLFHPAILSGFAQLQTDEGDTRFNHYLLEHSYRWLRGDAFHASLWDPTDTIPT